jgi:hypothetical protein
MGGLFHSNPKAKGFSGQSSRSLRLGVRLGSLARKPNTKIPINNKTTE